MRNITLIDNLIEEGLRLAWDEGPEPAIYLLDSLLQNESCEARLHHALGLIHGHGDGDQRKAEQHFRMAIQLDPCFTYSYWHLSKLLRDEGRYSDALEVYQSGIIRKNQVTDKIEENQYTDNFIR
jgi:tetratricopeptide (TPR) repeat protein